MGTELENLAFHACETGDIPTLQQFFSEHDVSAVVTPCGSQSSLVRAACMGSQLETFKFLLSQFTDYQPWVEEIGAAIEQNCVELVKEICLRRPEIVTVPHYSQTMLAYSMQTSCNPEIVKVLLDAGADPNGTPEHLGRSDIQELFFCNLPASTLEQFFDAGFNQGERLRALVNRAVFGRQPQLIKVLYARGKELPGARLPGPEELMQEVHKKADPPPKEMVDMVKEVFPEAFPDKPGLLARLLAKVRKSEQASRSSDSTAERAKVKEAHIEHDSDEDGSGV